MSGHADENLSVSAAGAIEAAAAAWLRQKQGDWSEDRQRQLDEWLAQSQAHCVAFWRLEAAWERSARLEALRPLSQRAAVSASCKPFRIFARVAAAMVVAAGLGAALTLVWPQPGDAVYATAVGQRKHITLGDGTRIELNTNSVLRLVPAAAERKVVLERGEAFFDVTHNAERPFVVIAGTHRIKDLGTKFTVRQNRDNLQVALTEGQAEIGPIDGRGRDRSLVLKPGDLAIASTSGLAVVRRSADEMSDEMAWRRGMLIFNHTSLADAAAEFNRYNAAKLIIADPAIAERTIGGKFSTADINGFVEIIQKLLGVRVTHQGQDFVVSH